MSSTPNRAKAVTDVEMTGPAAGPVIAPLGALPFPLEERADAPHVAVVIPALNEEPVLEMTYVRLRQVMEEFGVS
jgi:hypothetical protein